MNTVALRLVMCAFLFVNNVAFSLEQVPPAKISKQTSLSAAHDRERNLDLSKLVRKNTELSESGFFSTNSLFPPPVVDVVVETPTAPTLPFVFLGRINQLGTETIFLSIDNRSFSAKLNDILDGTYSVDSIEQDKIVFMYLPLKTQQVMSISRGE